MSAIPTRRAILAGLAIDPAIAHRAAVNICDRAHDVDDARQLIDMLGLNGRRLRSSEKSRRIVGGPA